MDAAQCSKLQSLDSEVEPPAAQAQQWMPRAPGTERPPSGRGGPDLLATAAAAAAISVAGASPGGAAAAAAWRPLQPGSPIRSKSASAERTMTWLDAEQVSPPPPLSHTGFMSVSGMHTTARFLAQPVMLLAARRV